jgi:two-component system cell cycle response regulator DivK
MSRSILLIEDNEQNRYLVTFLLEQRGFQVRGEPDGPRGIEAARTFVPALILLDIQLPGMNGYSVARALRENESLRDTPIVAVTSYAMPGDREKALEAGCTGYIEKPIDPRTFVAEIEHAIAGRRGENP